MTDDLGDILRRESVIAALAVPNKKSLFQQLAHTARVTFEIMEAEKRPVSAVADNFEVRDVLEVRIAEDREVALPLDPTDAALGGWAP